MMAALTGSDRAAKNAETQRFSHCPTRLSRVGQREFTFVFTPRYAIIHMNQAYALT
jgi:hypothetical protein